MRLNLRLIGIIVRAALHRHDRPDFASAPAAATAAAPLMLGSLLMALGAIGVFFGRLIQAAVSRQREFLADASSVQFTRNPPAFPARSKKSAATVRLNWNRRTPPTRATCFLPTASANRSSARWPRIRRFPSASAPLIRPGTENSRLPDEQVENLNLYRAALKTSSNTAACRTFLATCWAARFSRRAAWTNRRSSTHSVLPNLGNPTPLHLKYAEQLRDALPENLKAAAREPLDATALIYALLLSPDEKQRAAQARRNRPARYPAVFEKTAALYPEVAPIAAHARLPLVNLALGALQQLTAPQYRTSFRRRSNGSSAATGKSNCLNSSCKKSSGATSRRSLARRAARRFNFTRSSRSCRTAP